MSRGFQRCDPARSPAAGAADPGDCGLRTVGSPCSAPVLNDGTRRHRPRRAVGQGATSVQEARYAACLCSLSRRRRSRASAGGGSGSSADSPSRWCLTAPRTPASTPGHPPASRRRTSARAGSTARPSSLCSSTYAWDRLPDAGRCVLIRSITESKDSRNASFHGSSWMLARLKPSAVTAVIRSGVGRCRLQTSISMHHAVAREVHDSIEVVHLALRVRPQRGLDDERVRPERSLPHHRSAQSAALPTSTSCRSALQPRT